MYLIFFFIDSVQDLTQGFGVRSKHIRLPNHDLTVFNLSEVSESYLLKMLGRLKISKARMFLIVILY